MDAQTSELSRLHMGLVLFFLAHPRGGEAFMAGLRSEDAALRKLVLDQFKELYPDDLGYGGLPGKLPAIREEVFAAVMPLLQDPASYEGDIALSFLLGKQVFALSYSLTRPLLTHDNQAVRSKVALAYVSSGRDDGAFDALANRLFAPVISNERQSRVWFDWRHRACAALKSCAAATQDPDMRMRAGLLALRVIQETLRTRRAQGRFREWREERLPTDVLLQTIVLTRPPGAEEVLLREAIDSPDENLHLRSLALLSYVDLSGDVPSCAQAIIDAVVAQSDVTALDSRLEQFVARKMIGLPTLLAAARNPAWCYMATKAIGAWPRGAEDNFIVDGLILALGVMAARVPAQYDGSLEYVAELLGRYPRTAAYDRAIIATLKTALEIAKQSADKPEIAQSVLHRLVMFGEVSVDQEDNIDPWDATSAYWQRNGIGWNEASRMLFEACAIDDPKRADSVKVDAGGEGKLNEQNIVSGLCKLLGNRYVSVKLEDQGNEFPRHDALLQEMAAIVRPPIGAGAFSQICNSDECQVQFVYQDRVYGFQARPNCDWLDVWALIDGFNSFLREIGCAQRIFRLADPSEGQGEWGILLCAHEGRFLEVNEHLRLPLQPR